MPNPIRQAVERLQEYAAAHPEHDTAELVAAARAALAAEPPAPDPREALAARPLLEAVARLGDCIGQHTVGEITTISDRAAAWLRENPPGQLVAIEPRGCPTPGACSCVEPPAPAPVADHIPGVRNMVPATDYAARLRRCPTHGQQPANAWGCPECVRELRKEVARLRATAADGVAAPTPDDFRRWWRETGLNDSGPTPEMLLIANAWASSWAARCAQPIPQPVPVADGEREGLAQWLDDLADDYDDLYRPRPGLQLYRAAALLREARPQPVPVADRPWERPGWCDAEGRCWWGRCADDFFSPEWTMATLASIEEFCSDAMPQHCLPHWAITIPQPPQVADTGLVYSTGPAVDLVKLDEAMRKFSREPWDLPPPTNTTHPAPTEPPTND